MCLPDNFWKDLNKSKGNSIGGVIFVHNSCLRRALVGAALMMCTTVAGCGTAVPTISEPWEKGFSGHPDSKPYVTPVTASGELEFEIKKNVYCELLHAVTDLKKYDAPLSFRGKIVDTQFIPDSWGVQLSLTMEVDDNGAANPGVSFITPLSAMHSHSIGLGAQLSSTATRLDKYSSYYNIGYLKSKDAQNPCDTDPFDTATSKADRSSFLVSNLAIKEWLADSLFVSRSILSYGTASGVSAPGSLSSITPNGPSAVKKKNSSQGAASTPSGSIGQDAVSIEIKFIVVTTGTVNPSWSLQRVQADTGMNPLLFAGRTRTHDLILTVGPATPATDYSNLSLQIGQAVSSSARTALSVR